LGGEVRVHGKREARERKPIRQMEEGEKRISGRGEGKERGEK